MFAQQAIMFAYVFALLNFNGPPLIQVISESIGPIFTKFSGLVDIWDS